jgi:CheY-like chemotaxis protein
LELQTVMSGAELLATAAQRAPDTVILDLCMPNIDVAKLVPGLRALQPPPGRVVAFGPHVHGPLLQQAKDAGCDEVLTRGQFHANIDAVLIGH